MEQVITVNVKLKPNKFQSELLSNGSLEYILVINTLVSEMVEEKKATKKSSANIVANLNSTVKNQAIKDAKSVFAKAKKSKYKIIPILKKPKILWNNQNYSIKEKSISMPFMINGKSKKLDIKAILNNDIFYKLGSGKLGTLRITKKANKWIAQVAITIPTEPKVEGKTMGVD